MDGTSITADRIVKLREYAAVPTMRRYVILESTSVGLTVFERSDGAGQWTAVTLTDAQDILRMPEIGVGIPAGGIYAGVEFGTDAGTDESSMS